MQIYLAGTDVTVAIPLVDDLGNVIAPASISYRVVDQDDTEVVPATVIAAPAADAQLEITVPASANAVAAVSPASDDVSLLDTSTYGSRTLQLTVLLAGGNTVSLAGSYALRPAEILVVGLNSFVTYAKAQLTRLSIATAPGWDAANEDARTAALIEARDHLVQLNYYLLNTNVNFGQDSLNYIPEGQYVSRYAATNSLFMFNGMLGLLTPQEYSQLPTRFKLALEKAQVAEADHLLQPNQIELRRQYGLVSDAIGETRQTFRASKPLQMPCCRRAMSYLSYFLTNTKMIGRA
ncbi:hypothetical protein ACODYM_29245 [Burkholderia gladioli]|uniref:hypothetical protein n=1 Tax=Burkholderia gladioli TaxID=28095 RepID=UPI003B512BEB